MKKGTTAFRLLVLLASLGLVAGCSGIRTYPNNMDKNLFVEVEADAGVRLSMHVYRVNSNCDANYKGTVFLNGKRSEVGIPTGRTSYLVFNFSNSPLSSFFLGKRSTNHGTLLRAKRGKVYTAKVVYDDNMYNVEIREAKSAGAKGREVKYRELSDCAYVN